MIAPQVSPPKAVGTGTYPPGATFGPRRGTDWALIWILSGDCEYRWQQHRIAVPAGSMALTRPADTDGWRWDSHHATRHAFLHFDLLSAPLEWGEPSAWEFMRVTSDGDLLQTLFLSILAGRDRMDAAQSSAMISALLAAFVNGVYLPVWDPEAQSPLPPAVVAALRHIYARIDGEPEQALTLRQIAAAACTSPEHLCRLFRASTGHTPAETVRLARLDRALSLLIHTNYGIGEVAARCGFPGGSRFAAAFRAAFGMSARELRRCVALGQTPPAPRLYRVNFR